MPMPYIGTKGKRPINFDRPSLITLEVKSRLKVLEIHQFVEQGVDT